MNLKKNYKMKELKEFFNKYNINVKNDELYDLAFTHSSFNNDANTHHHDYERLEFLGDSVLSFVVGTQLFLLRNDMQEGDLTKARSYFVQSKSLANYARKEGFHEFIKIGHSLDEESLIANNSILEDVFEAVIGAIYLDQGIDFVSNFIIKIFNDDIKHFTFDEMQDYKSLLQEAMQAEYRQSVKYKVIDEKGPPHNRTFYVEVSFNGLVLGYGEGKSKKEAEQNAAKSALGKKATL